MIISCTKLKIKKLSNRRILSERQQGVKIGNTVSNWSTANGGMTQGTWLKPFILKVLINDLMLSLPAHKFIEDTTVTEMVAKSLRPATTWFIWTVEFINIYLYYLCLLELLFIARLLTAKIIQYTFSLNANDLFAFPNSALFRPRLSICSSRSRCSDSYFFLSRLASLLNLASISIIVLCISSTVRWLFRLSHSTMAKLEWFQC